MAEDQVQISVSHEVALGLLFGEFLRKLLSEIFVRADMPSEAIPKGAFPLRLGIKDLELILDRWPEFAKIIVGQTRSFLDGTSKPLQEGDPAGSEAGLLAGVASRHDFKFVLKDGKPLMVASPSYQTVEEMVENFKPFFPDREVAVWCEWLRENIGHGGLVSQSRYIFYLLSASDLQMTEEDSVLAVAKKAVDMGLGALPLPICFVARTEFAVNQFTDWFYCWTKPRMTGKVMIFSQNGFLTMPEGEIGQKQILFCEEVQ